MASSNGSYPCPLSEFEVSDIVTVELSRTNYYLWRVQMLGLIRSHDMIGFLDGTIQAPSPGRDDDYEAWKRSDSMIVEWIASTFDKDFVGQATAKTVWMTLHSCLARPFLPKSLYSSDAPRYPAEGKEVSKYLPLYEAAVRGNSDKFTEFIEKEPDSINTIITGGLERALMVAVRTAQRNHIVKKLLERLPPEDLALVNFFGQTPLHIAAGAGNFEAVKLLVQKNPLLPYVVDNSLSLPIHVAAACSQKDIVEYLVTVTKLDLVVKLFDEMPPAPLDEQFGKTYGHVLGVELIHLLIAGGLYEVALSLLKCYQKLGLASVKNCPLTSIAMRHSAFPSGTPLKWWQRIIYSCVPTQLDSFVHHNSEGDIENPANTRIPVRQSLRTSFWKVAETVVPHVKHIRETKLKHRHAIELVEFLCQDIAKLDHLKAAVIFGYPLRTAACVGNHEVVEKIFKSFPSAVFLNTETGQSVFHLAIVYRREKVFNLIYQFEALKFMFLSRPDSSMNIALHLAACLETQQTPNLRASAAGAALQMQRELQWFQEVEKLSLPQDKEKMNKDLKTPGVLFTETHLELVKEGEQWMKDTANSCTIAATLIVTIVFAAAITVPGGNNGETGLPILFDKLSFTVFAISDALALFSSTSSMLMFLSILTSRYAERDFLYSLPKKLIIGLVTLFLSVISMMITFGATLLLVFGDKRGSIFIPVAALTCVPVTLFASLQFPLLVAMVESTYGAGIFGKQSNCVLF